LALKSRGGRKLGKPIRLQGIIVVKKEHIPALRYLEALIAACRGACSPVAAQISVMGSQQLTANGIGGRVKHIGDH
jgi:hypothetical protein